MTARIPTLETERLLIRELAPDDLQPLHQLLNDALGTDATIAARERWLQWTVLGYQMFAMLEQPHYGERAIVLKERGELIGAVGIVPYVDTFPFRAGEMATAEVGLFWVIASPHQGQGYATEAARVVAYYLHRYLKLERVIATTGPGNLASQAVMRKLGMTLDHVDRGPERGVEVVGVLDNRSAWRSGLHAVLRHPTAPAVYLWQWKSGWGLPRALEKGYMWSARTEAIAAALQKRLRGEVWINRLVHSTEDEEKKRVDRLYEVECAGCLQGGEWVDRTRLAALPLREEHLRPVLEGYLQALEAGERPRQRPAWTAPGWRDGVRRWLQREVGRLGHTVCAVEQVKQWSLSAVLRVQTNGPSFYFKVPVALPLFVDEASVTPRLARRFPAHVLAPVAADPARGWMLFPDAGEPFSWHSPLADRAEVVRRFAYLQRETAGLVDKLLADGCLDRRLDVLARQIDPLLADPDAVAGLAEAETEALRVRAPELKELCRRLAEYAIPHTLVHGDLHVGNAARLNGEVVYFDWTDACIAHPFFDLLSLRWEENIGERAAVRAAYLEAWEGCETPARLREVVAIADVLLPLHHAVSYHTLQAGVEPAARAELGSPADFLKDVLPALERLQS